MSRAKRITQPKQIRRPKRQRPPPWIVPHVESDKYDALLGALCDAINPYLDPARNVFPIVTANSPVAEIVMIGDVEMLVTGWRRT